MLKWPGENEKFWLASSGRIYRGKGSSVACFRRGMRGGQCSMGSGTRPGAAISVCSSMGAIHIQQLQSGCLQALGDDLHKALVNVVAEVVVLVALGAQTLAVKGQRMCSLLYPCVKMPEIGRE